MSIRPPLSRFSLRPLPSPRPPAPPRTRPSPLPSPAHLRTQHTSTRPFQLTLYTAPHCDLCTLMRQEIDRVSQTVPLSLSSYNIRDDSLPDVAKWRRRYQYDIPVLHLDGREIFRHRLKAQELIEVLQRAETAPLSLSDAEPTSQT